MVAANFADNGIQQSHTTSKEMKFHLFFGFWIDTKWERKVKLKIAESKKETDIETQFLNEKLYMDKVNSDCHFWNFYHMKMRILSLFLITTWLNSLKLHMKLRLRLELGNVNLNNETGIYK